MLIIQGFTVHTSSLRKPSGHFYFGERPEIVGMGFSESTNKLRLFMGLPKTYSTYQGVSPNFLLNVIIRVIVGVILCIYLYKSIKKTNI